MFDTIAPRVRPREPDHDVPARRALAAQVDRGACRSPGQHGARPGERDGRHVRRPRRRRATGRSRSTLSLGMLKADHSGAPRVQADILRLPIPDGAVDGITCGFALRNLVELPAFFAGTGQGRPPGRTASRCSTSAFPAIRSSDSATASTSARSCRRSVPGCPTRLRTATSRRASPTSRRRIRWSRRCAGPASATRATAGSRSGITQLLTGTRNRDDVSSTR